jgi:hypothetical protein
MYFLMNYTVKKLVGNKLLFKISTPLTVFFHQCGTNFMLITTVFFLNHRGRKKTLTRTDGNKFDLSVKKIFPLHLFE